MGMNSARNGFFDQIALRMADTDIYIVSADLAGPPFDVIREKYPERFVQVGIAEQNMLSVAVGIASTGAKTIAYTSNPFIGLRGLDQVRNGVAMMHLPLAIVGVGTGFSIAEYGTTHFCTEDVALLSLCPGIRQITVSDDAVAQMALRAFLQGDSLLYLRFDKMCGGVLFKEEPQSQLGFRIEYGEDRGTLLITQGYPSQLASTIDWPRGRRPSWMDVFALPFDEDRLLEEVIKAERIVVCEEQQRRGGLGSLLLELFNDRGLTKELIRLGVAYGKGFPEVYGSREYWFQKYGLSGEAMLQAVLGA